MRIRHLLPKKNGAENSVTPFAAEDPFYAMERRINNLFGSLLGGFEIEPSYGFGKSLTSFSPKLDISETDAEIKVSVELAGMDEKDIEVVLDGDALTIKGEKKEEHEDKKGDYYRKERRYGSFERRLTVPDGINADAVKAEVKKGVLKITLPKLPEAQEHRKKIEVKGE